jgi:hypothetical protein
LARNWRELHHIPHQFDPVSGSTIVREFRDAAGAEWRVFRATPHTSPTKREKVLPESFRNGWLVFECEVERRRLAPIPDAWEDFSEAELEQLCRLAVVVPVRRTLTSAAERASPLAGSEVERSVRSSAEEAIPVRAAQMQEVLAQVIDEVCDQPRAPSLDTGELIKVEKSLALAAQAAREAVALRRSMREDMP